MATRCGFVSAANADVANAIERMAAVARRRNMTKLPKLFIRHCEPTGRANARPMTGSAKQSIVPQKERMDCFASLAMTVLLSRSDQRVTILGQQQNLRDADLHWCCRGNEVRPLAGLAFQRIDGVEADIDPCA